MNQLLKFILIVLTAGLLAFAVVEKQADCAAAIVDEIAFADQQASIQMPDLPPLYLLGEESVSFESLTDGGRFQFQSLRTSQFVPRDFSFRNAIRLTFCLIDHEAPVPVFIRGHALLC